MCVFVLYKSVVQLQRCSSTATIISSCNWSGYSGSRRMKSNDLIYDLGFLQRRIWGRSQKEWKISKEKNTLPSNGTRHIVRPRTSAVVVVLSPTTAVAIEVAAATTAVVSLCSCLSKKRPPEGGPYLTIFFFWCFRLAHGSLTPFRFLTNAFFSLVLLISRFMSSSLGGLFSA